MMLNALEIYEKWDEKINQCYWEPLICHLTTVSAKKELHAKHFCLQKKIIVYDSVLALGYDGWTKSRIFESCKKGHLGPYTYLGMVYE